LKDGHARQQESIDMESLEFSEVAALLNFSSSISIGVSPKKSFPGSWDLYIGAYTIHGRRYPFEVLYLHANASQEGILRAKQDAFHPGDTQVVFAPSLPKRLRTPEELLKPAAERFVSLPEYLASFVQEELKGYTARLIAREPKYYVAPRITTPRGIARKLPNPIENFLADPASDETEDGHVAVLLAEPGQGKTFMCDFLVSRLARQRGALHAAQRFAPIYINAEQWSSMDESDLASLNKTMTHCFRYFEAPIGWLAGHEAAFLHTTLRAGLFRVVFDGFDEYILRSHGTVTAVDALSGLIKLAKTTGTRIVITARTNFWESEIASRVNDVEDASDLLFVYHMEPFQYDQAVQYFNLRLGDRSRATTRASELYKRLQYGGDRFVGRGFVLSLIADLYERDPEFEATEITGGPVSWLLHALCEREQLRQALPLGPSEQLSILMQCAVEEVRGRHETDSGVMLLVQMENANLDEDAARSCCAKLRSHPLIARDPTHDQWKITQGQAKVALVARFLGSRVSLGDRDELINRFSRDADWDPGFYDDLAAMLVEQNAEQSSGDDERGMRALLESLLQSGDAGFAALPRLATLTALRFVDAHFRAGVPRDDRTRALSTLFPNGRFQELRFSGSISRYDFRGVTFTNCKFEGVRWTNCRFDGTTIFDVCNFRGGSVDHCVGFGGSLFQRCDGDETGMAVVQAEQIAAGSRSYTDSDLRSDIRAVVRKFISRGGFVLKTVREDHLRSGSISRSRHAELVIQEVGRQILDFHNISGASDGGAHVKADAIECVKFFATNNVFTGPLEQAYQKLKVKIGVP
jgi:uncharacterized protein YjbI with pentapeptide repeats